MLLTWATDTPAQTNSPPYSPPTHLLTTYLPINHTKHEKVALSLILIIAIAGQRLYSLQTKEETGALKELACLMIPTFHVTEYYE